MYPTKQIAVAEMFVTLQQTCALFEQAIGEARIDPAKEERLRAYAAQYTIMENANELCRLAIRTCGGQAMLKSLPLERLYRDSRCGSLMLPWTAELCLDRLGRETLYEPGERRTERGRRWTSLGSIERCRFHARQRRDRIRGRDFPYAFAAGVSRPLARCSARARGRARRARRHLGYNGASSCLLFACARLGALLVPLNWRLAAPEQRASSPMPPLRFFVAGFRAS